MTQRALSLPRRRPSALLRLLPSGRALLVATALVLIAAGLYGLARGTSMFAVRTVEVQGASPALAATTQASAPCRTTATGCSGRTTTRSVCGKSRS